MGDKIIKTDIFYQEFCARPHTVHFTQSLLALAGVAQWIECQPANQRVTSLFPSQDTGLGCGPGPQ